MVRFEITQDVFVEVSEGSVAYEVVKVLEMAKAHIAWVNTHSFEERDSYNWHVLSDLLDKTYYVEEYKDFYNVVDKAYWDVQRAEDKQYRDYAEADFLEYASHKGEADFDWDYYSDWHKDLYGFRPRW